MQINQAEMLAATLPVVGDLPTHFERPAYLAAAGALAATAAAYEVVRSRSVNARAEEQEALFPAGADFVPEASNQVRWTRWAGRGFVAGLALAGSGQLASMSQPSTDSVFNRVNRVAVVVDAGADSYAKDVSDTGKNGQVIQIPRVQAGLNAALRFANEVGTDIAVDFTLAGSQPKKIGTVNGTDGSKELRQEANKYFGDLGNANTPDIAGALAVAQAGDPDYIFVMTADPSLPTSDALAILQGNKTVISAGQVGSSVNVLGQKKDAGYTSTFGPIKGIPVQSARQLQGAIRKATDRDIAIKKRRPNELFDNVRTAGVILGLASAAPMVASIPRRKYGRGSTNQRRRK